MKHEILLIDDEKDIRFAVAEILKENNFLVREADTIEKALFEICLLYTSPSPRDS